MVWLKDAAAALGLVMFIASAFALCGLFEAIARSW